MDGTSALQATPQALRRSLGLWQVSVAGVGVILGAGVYALIGPAAAEAGSALWLAFVVAGAAAGLTAYAYARLGAMQPKTSPEFQYTALGFGPRVGFVAGWLMLFADIAAAASVALGFGGYLSHLLGVPLLAAAIGLVGLAVLAVARGVGTSVPLAVALTGVEAAGLLFIIVIGLPAWRETDFTQMPAGLGGIGSAAALIFFAYLGFDELGNFAEEMRAPKRDLPRALWIALVTTTLIYVAVALSATALVPSDVLGRSPAPLATAAGRVLGGAADATLSLVALAATANTVLLLLFAASRSVYGMATAGVLPRALGRLTRSALPLRALVAVTAVAWVLVLIGDLTKVARLTDAAVLISFGLVNASLLRLALARRTPATGSRRALEIVLPTLGIVLCGGLLAYSGWVWILAAGAIGIGGAVFVPAVASSNGGQS
jgi:basic amino acid/polyamine antiporter, APA family